jgi:hypothetical protein
LDVQKKFEIMPYSESAGRLKKMIEKAMLEQLHELIANGLVKIAR